MAPSEEPNSERTTGRLLPTTRRESRRFLPARSIWSVAGRTWAGVDVGGKKKGFHAVVIDDGGVVAGPQNIEKANEVVMWLERFAPVVVAVDSPSCAAPAGERSRAGERALASAVCGIRWTPDAEALAAGGAYFEWIRNGLELYACLATTTTRWEIIEVFPTASFTVWGEKRGQTRRARWSRLILEGLALGGLPSRRLNQDDRDAIAAALTARFHDGGETQTFGEIVVPSRPP
jgi:predicted nuclease with RNAse H fold